MNNDIVKNNLSHWITSLKHLRPWSILAIVLLLLGVGSVLVITHTHDAQKIESVHHQLDHLTDIEQHLTALITQTKQTPPASTEDVEKLATQINTISEQLGALKTVSDNTDEIKTTISTSTVTLSEQLDLLKQLTLAIKSAVTKKAYLPVSALPFTVVGIDLWNGELKATLRSQGELAPPMGVQDTKDGWTLITLTSDPAQAIFQNRQGQKVLVKVSL